MEFFERLFQEIGKKTLEDFHEPNSGVGSCRESSIEPDGENLLLHIDELRVVC